MAEALNTNNPARDLATYWTQEQDRFKASRDLIARCALAELQTATGPVAPVVPTKDGIMQGFPVQLPHSTTMPQDVASFVARRRPQVRRNPGPGARAERISSQIEEWLQAALDDKVKIDGTDLWSVLTAHATHDSEFAVLVQPAPSHYSGLLSLYDDDGSTLRVEWQRNTDGLARDEYAAQKGSEKGYRPSLRKSTAAHNEYERSWKAKRWPFVVRVLSAPEYLPIGRDPLTGRLDTLLVRSQCTATHLRSQGFEFWAQSTGEAGAGQSYWLYELHTSNPWQILYQVVGLDGIAYQTSKDGMPAQQALDMSKQFGLNTLHAGVFYGWNRTHEKDPDKRGIPLLAPFLGVIGAANRSITGIVEHLHETGFGGWGIKMEKDLYEVWVEMGRPTQFDMQDRSIHVLLGEPVSLVHEGVGADAWRVVEFLHGLVEQFNESDKVRSDPSSSSIAQTTSLASADTVLSQISQGAMEGYKLVAEALLEQCSVLSEQTGGPIPIYCHVNKDGEEQRQLELGAQQIMGDFLVDVEQPTKKWSNLPLAQAGTAWQQVGLVSKREWREDFAGDPQPEKALDEIAAEQYVDSQPGQQEVQRLVAKIQGDRDRARIQDLQDQGQLSPGMTPTAALPPQPAGGNGVAPNGVPQGMPNQAASAVGGMTAAAVNPSAQTNVVAATGQGAETTVP